VWVISVCLMHVCSRSYSLVVQSVSLHLLTASPFQVEKIMMIFQLFRASGLDSQREEVVL